MPEFLIERTMPPADQEAPMAVGERFARAIAAYDRDALLGLLAPEVAFRAMTPSRVWDATAAGEVVDVILGTWFGGDRHIQAVERIDRDRVADLERVGYRFRAITPDGESIVEQQAYVTVDGDVITGLRIMCSGFRPAHGSTLRG